MEKVIRLCDAFAFLSSMSKMQYYKAQQKWSTKDHKSIDHEMTLLYDELSDGDDQYDYHILYGMDELSIHSRAAAVELYSSPDMKDKVTISKQRSTGKIGITHQIGPATITISEPCNTDITGCSFLYDVIHYLQFPPVPFQSLNVIMAMSNSDKYVSRSIDQVILSMGIPQTVKMIPYVGYARDIKYVIQSFEHPENVFTLSKNNIRGFETNESTLSLPEAFRIKCTKCGVDFELRMIETRHGQPYRYKLTPTTKE